MKTKAVVLLAGGLVALLLLSRYFALSRSGVPLGWMLYLGLPITAAGVLFALRLINLGTGWGAEIDDVKHNSGAPASPLARPSAAGSVSGSVFGSVSERLRELEALHATGAISETEYAARRLRIISSI
jgi:hypothetical protein